MLPIRALMRPSVLTASAVLCTAALVGLLTIACAPIGERRGGTYSATELGIEVSRSVGAESRAAPRTEAAGTPAATGADGAASQQVAPLPEPTRPPPEGTFVTPGQRLGIAGCPVFPDDHAFRAWIGRLPVHPRSDTMIAAAGGSSMTLDAGFSARPWQGARAGYPVNIADSRNNEVVDVIGGQGAATSDLHGHPVPPAPRFEGWPTMRWDKHLLVVDPATCTSHEMIGVTPPSANPLGAWFVNKAVKIDLRSNEYRPGGSVKVSGVSMLAGLVRYDEVVTGEVGHVIAMSIPNARAGAPVWPARASDGPNPDPAAPPMGSWLRLRSDVDLTGLGPQARTIARALSVHGGVVADTGGRWVLNGEPDTRWDDADLNTLRSLTMADFEVVDPTPMIVSRDSLRIR